MLLDKALCGANLLVWESQPPRSFVLSLRETAGSHRLNGVVRSAHGSRVSVMEEVSRKTGFLIADWSISSYPFGYPTKA
jgi:hypothetical protein